MALAQNHVHVMGVLGLPAGSVKIFVIHCMFQTHRQFFFPFISNLKNKKQSHTCNSQSMGNFPTSHGKTASFFLDVGVQQEYAFIPDDGSATFVVNV